MTMLPYQIKECVVFVAVTLILMASFQGHMMAIGGLSMVGVLALDDLSWIAFRRAMVEDRIKRTFEEPFVYIIESTCRFKWLVWRQATVAAEWHRAQARKH